MSAPGVLRRLLNALLPSRCPMCRRHLADEAGLCQSCEAGLGRARLEGRLVHLGPYRRGLEPVVHALKFGGGHALAGPLGRRLAGGVTAAGWRPDALVPVPLHPARRRRRGYNQSRLLAEAMGRELGVPVLEALERTRPTRPQYRLQRHERAANVAGAFATRADVAGLDLVLVDDVYTTGVTTRECERMLTAGGARRVRLAVVSKA